MLLTTQKALKALYCFISVCQPDELLEITILFSVINNFCFQVYGIRKLVCLKTLFWQPLEHAVINWLGCALV